jgi:hypothetical protein
MRSNLGSQIAYPCNKVQEIWIDEARRQLLDNAKHLEALAEIEERRAQDAESQPKPKPKA